MDERGLARRGLLIRHLVLPDNIADTEKVLDFIAHEISPNTYLNLMDQYRPCYRRGRVSSTGPAHYFVGVPCRAYHGRTSWTAPSRPATG